MSEVSQEVTVKLPTTSDKEIKLHLEGDEVRIEMPVSLRSPKVTLEILEVAVEQLRILAGGQKRP